MDSDTLERVLLDRLNSIENHMGQRFDSQDHRFDAQDRAIARIEAKVDKDGGRLSTLEKARERSQGAISAWHWWGDLAKSLTVAAFGGGMTILLMAMTGAIR